MALQTQRAHVGQIAFASAFGYGQDVIGVPQVFALAPILFEIAARRVIQLALVFPQRLGVQAALRTHAAIPGEDLLSQIAGIGAQLPLAYASGGAECDAALGDLRATSAARAALAFHPSAGLPALRAHKLKS